MQELRKSKTICHSEGAEIRVANGATEESLNIGRLLRATICEGIPHIVFSAKAEKISVRMTIK